MCYLVTGVKPAGSVAALAHQYFRIFDTLEEAKQNAETCLRGGHSEVTIWVRVASPRVEQKVVWQERDSNEETIS